MCEALSGTPTHVYMTTYVLSFVFHTLMYTLLKPVCDFCEEMNMAKSQSVPRKFAQVVELMYSCIQMIGVCIHLR